MNDERCGTDAGYTAHRRRGEQACVPCRSARAEYRKSRREDPAVKRRNAEVIKARQVALRELSHLFPDEYRRLYIEAKAEIRGIKLKRGAA